MQVNFTFASCGTRKFETIKMQAKNFANLGQPSKSGMPVEERTTWLFNYEFAPHALDEGRQKTAPSGLG